MEISESDTVRNFSHFEILIVGIIHRNLIGFFNSPRKKVTVETGVPQTKFPERLQWDAGMNHAPKVKKQLSSEILRSGIIPSLRSILGLCVVFKQTKYQTQLKFKILFWKSDTFLMRFDSFSNNRLAVKSSQP